MMKFFSLRIWRQLGIFGGGNAVETDARGSDALRSARRSARSEEKTDGAQTPTRRARLSDNRVRCSGRRATTSNPKWRSALLTFALIDQARKHRKRSPEELARL